MEKERKDYNISIEKELEAIKNLSNRLIEDGFNAENTIVVTCCTDYSSITGMIIRHNLSKKGEVAYGLGIDLPYPDEAWTQKYVSNLRKTFRIHEKEFKNKTLLLCENGIIRGSNYNYLTNWIKTTYPTINFKTLTLFENIESKFKCDFVGDYYNDNEQNLTFSWEKENRHFY